MLGADFFYQHLVDADPASNTLSWRWVAGLHTKSKTYLARPDNIEKHTQGRFRPTDLAPYAEPVIDGYEIPDLLPPRQAETRVPDGPYALLLTSDDLHPESWPGYDTNPPALVIHVGQLPQEAELNSGTIAAGFTREAIEHTIERLDRPSAKSVATKTALSRLMGEKVLNVLAVPYCCSGTSRAFLNDVLVDLPQEGIAIHEVKRTWDDHAWPHATAGFFKLKKKIPKLLSQTGLIA